MSKYEELRKIDVSKHIEKKNNLSYLSWAWAVDVLLQQDASATWEYQEPKKFGETVMVFCSVTAFGKTMTAQLPVMDYRNKAIPNPDAFAVNTAMQRCLAKAIALHGLGLYIYAGEDLPEEDKDSKFNQVKLPASPYEELDAESQQFIKDLAIELIGDVASSDNAAAYKKSSNLLNSEKQYLWTLLDSKTRSALKKEAEANKNGQTAQPTTST
jgi:hypothetical protein